MSATTGGCACGAVRYEFDDEAVFQIACHCRACQYASGGAPTYGMLVPRAAMRVTQGSPRTYFTQADSGAEVVRQFCETCGTPLFAQPSADSPLVGLKVGSLDDPSPFKPQVHIWTEAAPPWHPFEPGVARFPTHPG